jgi:hypothetical protein
MDHEVQAMCSNWEAEIEFPTTSNHQICSRKKKNPPDLLKISYRLKSIRQNLIDNGTLLVTDFVNLKIKPAQSFRGAHRGRVCVRVFIGVSSRTYEYLYLYCVSQKKNLQDKIQWILVSQCISCCRAKKIIPQLNIRNMINEDSR